MDRLCAFLEGNDPARGSAGPPLVAGVAPHDDFLYAGAVAWPLFRRIRAREVLILGVTHGTVRKALGNPEGVLLLESFDAWQGPYGSVAISPLRDRLKRDLPPGSWVEHPQAHTLEHSIEALLPFLQHVRRDVAIIPVMVTAMDRETMGKQARNLAGVLRHYLEERHLVLGRDVAILISADGNHYGPDFDNLTFGPGRTGHEAALRNEREVLEGLVRVPLTGHQVEQVLTQLWGADFRAPGRLQWCGKFSIPLGLQLLVELNRNGVLSQPPTLSLLAHGDTFSDGVLPFRGSDLGLTAPFSLQHWVSFFSLGIEAGR